MREPYEMVTASRIQNMVDIGKGNAFFVTIFLLIFTFRALGVESPRGGAMLKPFRPIFWAPIGSNCKLSAALVS